MPEPVDLEPLRESYDRPSGLLTLEVLANALREAVRRLQIAQDIGQLRVASEVVEELLEEPLEQAPIDGGVNPEVRARLVAKLRHTCAGPPDYEGPPDADQNGRLSLTVVAGADGIRPAISGLFEACRGRFRGRGFRIDGVVDLSLQRLSPVRLLAKVAGSIRTPQERFRGDFDFRVTPDRGLEVRVPTSTGDLIAGLAEGGDVQLLRDRATVWACSAARLRCRSMTTDEVMEVP